MSERTENPTASPEQRDFIITRVIDAPRDIVFRAWTEAEGLLRWWGPRNFTTPYCTVDFRPGGVCLTCMRSPEGRDYWNKGVYREIVEPVRLVITDCFADAEGNPVSPAEYEMPEWPQETLREVTFDEIEGSTKITMHESVSEAIAKRYQAPEGWNECLDRLEEYLTAHARA